MSATSVHELSPGAEAEWKRLRRYIELSEGFWLGFVFTASAHEADVLRERVTEMLGTHRPTRVLRPESPDELRNMLPVVLGKGANEAACIWVEGTERDLPGKTSSPWGDAWTWLVLRMNERRDAMRRQISGGLVLVMPPEMKPHVRDAASDLWAVRSIVLELPAEPPVEAPLVVETFEDGKRLIVASTTMKEVLQMARRIAQTDVNVLIHGETGVGKELVARFIHKRSPRRDAPLVFVDCAAIPDAIAASLLFGHVPGAFTGALRKTDGVFVAASGGTLVLDEIAALSIAVQVKLLRVLQDRMVVPIGGTGPIPVNVRLVATVNRDLEKMVRDGKFRGDLYYRLATFMLHVPPLRERKEDIRAAIGVILDRFNDEGRTQRRLQISSAAIDALVRQELPGNFRELEALLRSAAVRCRGDEIEIADLDLPQAVRATSTEADWSGGLAGRIRIAERAAILDALHEAGGDLDLAARLLRISVRRLERRMAVLKIRPLSSYSE